MKINLKIILIVFLACFALVDLLNSGMPKTHDGADHLARIANFYNVLSEGILFPRWAENLNWGYGHPILMFLYPFSSYVASFFHFIGFSYIDSLKLLFGLGFIASGVTMYIWAKEQFDDYVGIAAAVLYMYAPYRFVDMYVRGAVGEHMAFIFPPIILYFMMKISRVSKANSLLPIIGLSISFALFLLAHNAISLMFLPVFVGYGIYLAVIHKKNQILAFLLSGFVLGFLLSAFFTVPAFLEGKFTLRDIVANEEYKTRFVKNPLDFLYGKWSYGISGQFTVQIGIAQIIGLLLLPFVFLRNKINRKEKLLLVFLGVIFVLSLFFQLHVSNFLYEILTTLKKFQFPWRFLTLTVFATAILSSSFLLVVKNTFHKKILVTIFIVIALASTSLFFRGQEYFSKPDSFYNAIYHGTTDTGESAPIWSVRFMEKVPQAHLEVISGNAQVKEVKRTSIEHRYKVVVESELARFRENTVYFPSWKVLVDGSEEIIEFQDPANRGLITFQVSRGEHDVVVKFFDTKLRTLANVISILASFIVLVLIVIGVRKAKQKK